MTIYLGSRYQFESVQAAKGVDGVIRQFVQSRPVSRRSTAPTTYVWKDEDRIDRVAYELLGSPSLWHRIMDSNPDIEDPGLIRPGTVLKVPARG